jgi:hypothetical protein
MMCPRCKRPLPAGAPRCPRCAGRPKQPLQKARPSLRVPLIAGAILLGGLASYLFLGGGSGAPEAPAQKDPLAGLPSRVRDPKAVLREDHDTFASLEPGEARVLHVEADRDLVAVFEIFPTTGPVQAAATTVKSIEITPEEEGRLAGAYREVRPKASLLLHCEAKSGEIGECFIRNPGKESVTARVRLRWWSLGEPPPPAPPGPNDDVTKVETIPPGERLEVFNHAARSGKWVVEVTPKEGTVRAAMMTVESIGRLSDAEQKRLSSSLVTVSAPRTEVLKQSTRIGGVSYFLVLNPGEKPVTVEIRMRVGAAAK